jgi:hypothetical protein
LQLQHWRVGIISWCFWHLQIFVIIFSQIINGKALGLLSLFVWSAILICWLLTS